MIKSRNLILSVLAVVLLSWSNAIAQSANVRGMYVTDIDNWLGDSGEETDLLEYAQGNGYTYIAFYDLGSLSFNSSTTKNALASFIHRAKTQYGIQEIGACGENSDFFANDIIPYNNGRSSSTEKFDVLNLEFEFWVSSSISAQYCSRYLRPNGFSCDTAGAYKFAKLQFKEMDDLADANGLISEMYLGWPNKGQMQDVAKNVDRILLHAYRPDDSDVYQYSRNRLIDIASVNQTVEVIPIFSSESAFMGPWLNSHPLTQPFQTYASKYTQESGSWKQYIDLQGYHWFTYDHMPKTIMATASISASGPTTFCTGGSVTLTANSGSSYLWSPGGQTTRSITVTQSGNYTVTVESASGASVTSSPVSVSVGNTTTAPTISASGPTTFCASSSVTLTSSTADTYLWSNGETTKSITVNQSGNYTVTITSGTCTATSSSQSVTATPAPAIPTVSSSGPTTICDGTSVTLSTTSANGYYWSDGSNGSSITVDEAGTYWVRVYSAGNCYSQSADIEIDVIAAPAKPVITASGPVDLCPGESVVLSSSSNSGGYLWSTGETTQDITVSTPGTYWVQVFNGNNCSAQSSNKIVTVNSSTNPPVISASGSLSICLGNSVTLTSSSAVSYLWSNGETTKSISVSTAGTYYVTTGSGTCAVQSAGVTVTTNGPVTPVITASGSLDLCPGESVTLTSTSSNGYLWSNGENTQSIEVTEGGTYWVRGYVAGNCFAQSVNITVNELPAPPDPVISANGPLELSASNPTVVLSSSQANSYFWNNGISAQSIIVNVPGTYIVTVAGSNGCTSVSDPIVVTSVTCTPPPVPVISVSGSTILLPGESVILSAPASSAYLWSNGETTQSIEVFVSGSYSVRTYSGPSCFSTSLPVAVYAATTGIEDQAKASSFDAIKVYPNPARNEVKISYVSSSNQDAIISLNDITGREMHRTEFPAVNGDNLYDLNLADYPRGIYFVSLISGNERQTIRLILQ